MLSDEQGIKAIQALQKTVGITETEEQAKRGWNLLTDNGKTQTELAHKMVCGGFPEDENET